MKSKVKAPPLLADNSEGKIQHACSTRKEGSELAWEQPTQTPKLLYQGW